MSGEIIKLDEEIRSLAVNAECLLREEGLDSDSTSSGSNSVSSGNGGKIHDETRDGGVHITINNKAPRKVTFSVEDGDGPTTTTSSTSTR